FEISDKGGRMNVPEANFTDWKSASRSFENMAMYNSSVTPVVVGDQAIRARVSVVSDGFFDVFKIRPFAGHVAKDGAMVSYGFWQRVLGGGSLDARELHLFNQTMPITAVMPAD